MSSKTLKLGSICKVRKISTELKYLKSIDEKSEKCSVGYCQIFVCGHIQTKRTVAFISGLRVKKSPCITVYNSKQNELAEHSQQLEIAISTAEKEKTANINQLIEKNLIIDILK